MKLNTTICTIALLLLYNLTTGQVSFPADYPRQTLVQEFGLGEIKVTYHRPSAKGKRVFGDLVPLGKLWPASSALLAKITFKMPVEINSRKLDSGTYALYLVPGEERWEIVINKGVGPDAAEKYKEVEDVLRFQTEPIKTKIRTETFTIQIASISSEHCELHLYWEKRLIVIPIFTSIREKLRRQIETALLTDAKPYWQAARFYNEYDHNYFKALEQVNKALDQQPKAFWMFLYKAKIQREMGDFKGALASSDASLHLSKEVNNVDYIRMNEALQKEIKRSATPQHP